MRITRTMMLVLLAALLPASAHAQKLAGTIKRLFDNSTFNVPTPNAAGVLVNHQPHFLVSDEIRKVTREVNVALGAQLSSFPLASSSGGFTFSVNDRGEVTPTSTNFGPSFAERGVTIGRNQFNLGFTFQTTSYSSFEGVDLDSPGLDFVRVHNNCCGAGSDGAQATDLIPDFERDLLRNRLVADITTKTTAVFANYGVSDRFDIGVAVPFVNVQLDATVNSEILRLGSGTGTFHQFENGATTLSLSESGSASGLGDVLLRAKYNFLRSSTSAMAAALDLRLPTGDKDDLLGTGATQTKLFFVGSGEYGRFSPHVNLGYTFSNGTTSEDATSFEFDPARFALSTLPANAIVPSDIDLNVPDEVNYIMGFSVAPSSRVTFGFDLHGRQLRDVARFNLQNRAYNGRGTGAAIPTTTFTESDQFSLDDEHGNLNLMMGVVGGKINLGGTFLLNVTVLFPLTDNGLKPKPTPVIGFDYVF